MSRRAYIVKIEPLSSLAGPKVRFIEATLSEFYYKYQPSIRSLHVGQVATLVSGELVVKKKKGKYYRVITSRNTGPYRSFDQMVNELDVMNGMAVRASFDQNKLSELAASLQPKMGLEWVVVELKDLAKVAQLRGAVNKDKFDLIQGIEK